VHDALAQGVLPTMRLLLVEDDAMIGESVLDMLHTGGYAGADRHAPRAGGFGATRRAAGKRRVPDGRFSKFGRMISPRRSGIEVRFKSLLSILVDIRTLSFSHT
jgi:hypothetical protein